jgi:hypothetical protein
LFSEFICVLYSFCTPKIGFTVNFASLRPFRSGYKFAFSFQTASIMAIDLFSFNSTMRRLSCVPEALSLVPQRVEPRQDSSFDERRASQQEIDCAVQWLQRRKSTDLNGMLGQIDHTLYRKRNS